MYYIAVLLGLHIVGAAPPLQLTIDCGSQDIDNPRGVHRARTSNLRSSGLSNPADVDSICSIIHKALPKSVNDGKFILIGEPMDQSWASNGLAPITVPPPIGFIPRSRIKVPNLKVPRLRAPTLKSSRPLFAPRVGAPHFPFLRARQVDYESSAERMEKFKKGVQKMLHVVKVLGQIDKYISERTLSIVNVLSNTLAEREES